MVRCHLALIREGRLSEVLAHLVLRQMRLSLLPVLFCSATICLPLDSFAQPRTTISTTGCAACDLELVHVATLGTTTDPISPSHFQIGASRDSRGRYYVAPMADLAVVGVYDSSGKFLRTVGRSGAGPGEYGFIMRAEVLKGDSLLVLDVANSRITLLSPEYAPIRSIPMHGRYIRAFRISRDEFLVYGDVRSAAAAGFPLHIVANDGRVVRSFGSLKPEVSRDRPQAHLRHVAIGSDGDPWTLRYDRYELEKWQLSGSLAHAISRNASWFPPWDYSQTVSHASPPKAVSVDLWSDEAGMLWSMIRVPSARWTPYPRKPGVREPPMAPLGYFDESTDTIIEVLDPKSGRLLVSKRYEQYFFGQANGQLFSLRETADGDLRVEVWDISLRK